MKIIYERRWLQLLLVQQLPLICLYSIRYEDIFIVWEKSFQLKKWFNQLENLTNAQI